MTPFEKAFAAARKDKKATFSFNGKSYTTQLKGEPAVVKPKPRPGDKGKPSVMSEAPKQGAAPSGGGGVKGVKAAGTAPSSSKRPQARPTPKAAAAKSSPAKDDKPKEGVTTNGMLDAAKVAKKVNAALPTTPRNGWGNRKPGSGSGVVDASKISLPKPASGWGNRKPGSAAPKK